MKALVPVLAIAAIAFGVTGQASAAPGRSVSADLDGDGRQDTVSVHQVTANRQLLVAAVGGTRLSAYVPLDSAVGVRPPRVVDVDADGRDEVVVTESVGANTLKFTAWGLFGGRLAPITLPHGDALALWEGGGVSATSAYGCVEQAGGRVLVLTGGYALDAGFTRYRGERTTFTVADGVATWQGTLSFEAGRDDPRFQADPAACA